MDFLGVSVRSWLLMTAIMYSSILKESVNGQISTCLPPIDCQSIDHVDHYRTADGTCNNLEHPYWGAADIPFLRYIPRVPSGDAFRCPQCPEPRVVSATLKEVMPPDHKDFITLMVMQWGQLTDHDLLFTPEDEDLECCADFQTPSGTKDSCVPINVTGDTFYSSLPDPVTCLPFVRSLPANCTEGPDRQTINERTAYLDASTVYGSRQEEQDELRSGVGGKLRVGEEVEVEPCSPPKKLNVCPRPYLPTQETDEGDLLFLAGDHRVQHQPALTSLHTVLVRLHNYIAENLKCHHDDDETIFQTARKIVIAIVQQITYNEFLPIVLGDIHMDYYDLTLKPATNYHNAFSYDYNPHLSASAHNVFATACYRFGHSLVPDQFLLPNAHIVKLAETFENRSVTLHPHRNPSQLIGSVITQESEPMDHIMAEALVNFLLALPPFGFGSDLHARNIRRGRDHGIPGYVTWHNWCDPLHNITSFEDLYDVMPPNVVEAFMNLYENVEDIDMFPAGIAEYEYPGALVGPTFACLISKHFYNIKFGDRFWFERPHEFTLGQIQSIRQTTLASLICLFTSVEDSQWHVMLKEDPIYNPKEQCKKILRYGVLHDIRKSTWKHIC